MANLHSRLKRVLSRQDALALTFGTMVGWGWIILSAHWVEAAGVYGAASAFIVCAFLSIFVGMAYAELTAALPLAGGVMVFTYRGLGYSLSWLTAWTMVFAYLGVSAWEGIAISTAIGYIFQLPRFGYLWTVAGYDVYLSWSIWGILITGLIIYLNLKGMKYSAVFQISGVIAMVIVGLSFLFGGVSLGDIQNVTPLWTNMDGWITVLLMTPSMFIGFDVISEFAEEINYPLKLTGKILVTSIIFVALWYILMIMGFSNAVPPFMRVNMSVPVAEAMSYIYQSDLAGKIMVVGGIFAILTSWNGFILAASRVLFAMGRARMIHPLFGQLSPDTKAPIYPLFLVGSLTCLAPLLGKNALIWFVDISSFATVIAYFFVSLSFLFLRINESTLYRPYRAFGGKMCGIIAIIVSLLFIILYVFDLPSAMETNELGIMIGWVLLGFFFAVWSALSFGRIGKKERELLIFGEKYARIIK